MRFQEKTSIFTPVIAAVLGVGVVIVMTATGQAVGEGRSGWMPLVILFFLLALIYLVFGEMTVTVEAETLSVRYGKLGLIRAHIPLDGIKSSRAVEYRPLRQFGGWGIRSGMFEGKRTSCYTARGRHGVLLELDHEIRVCLFRSAHLIIGSDRPEELAQALKK